MKLQNSGFLSLEQVQNQYLNQQKVQTQGQSVEASFQKYLEQAAKEKVISDSPVRFSKHAASRLSTRNIELTQGQIDRLQEGTRKAEAKGINDSLVIVDSLAFIVNVPSNTVVTAMEQSETQDNIFTNIDGAVII
ncbi:MAG: flagellar protein [Lachnospiraceae bacterium]|nr:flagellar protein [Lachnospiraceae bacterium]